MTHNSSYRTREVGRAGDVTVKREPIWEYVVVLRERYRRAHRKAKGETVRRDGAAVAVSAEALIRLLRRDDAKPAQLRSGRPYTYGPELVPVLSQLSELSGIFKSQSCWRQSPGFSGMFLG